MARKTIITCAVTGNITSRQNHPELPVTPDEIATSGLAAADAGAAILHIHVRDPATGSPSMNVDLYADVIARIRERNSDVIINLTTGPGGRFVPSDHDPKVAAEGTTLTTPAERLKHVTRLKPEMCSLDLNTMYSGSSVVINTPQNVRAMAETIRSAGVKPELEVFDSGDIHLGSQLIAEGLISRPALFQIVLGVRYGFDAAPKTLAYAQSLLESEANWAAFGIGRFEFPMVAQAFLLGGHVRVGMEDNVYLRRGVLTPSNASLVEKAVTIVELLGGEIAKPGEARELIGL